MSRPVDPAARHNGRPTRSRPRERLHFTAPAGWINDPHGICWAGGRYHLFFQYNPFGTVWSPRIHWGHAVSTNLVEWRYAGVALAPRRDEVGCWSGSTIVENDRPTIVYTSARSDDWGHGRVALAIPDEHLQHWSSDGSDVLIDGAPAELLAHAFRDPCLLRTGQGWTMVVGAGVAGGIGAAVQYRSDDARRWDYAGVVCSRPGSESEGIRTGAVWECPQLVEVGDDWVLIVSVWEDDALHHVAAAVGAYDGSTFTPEKWSRLTHDDVSYAMTSFVDDRGRPCVMSWLRESAAHDPTSSPWAGSLSLPMVIGVGPDRTVVVQPHPDVDLLRRPVPTHSGPSTDQPLHIAGATTGLDVTIVLGPGRQIDLTLADGDGTTAVIRLDGDRDLVVVERAGWPDAAVPRAAEQVRIIIDTDLVDVFAGAGAASLRTAGTIDANLTIDGAASMVTVYRLSPAFYADNADHEAERR